MPSKVLGSFYGELPEHSDPSGTAALPQRAAKGLLDSPALRAEHLPAWSCLHPPGPHPPQRKQGRGEQDLMHIIYDSYYISNSLSSTNNCSACV